MDQSLLATIINNHQTTLSRLADAWMDWGASAFYLTDAADKVLAQWPTVVGIGPATFAAPIVISGRVVGKLHICGKESTIARLRLGTDAQMFSDVLQLEYELERMTTDIIDQQDRLMALHQLAQSTRVHNGLSQTLADLAQITAHLLKTDYAFMALQRDQQPPLLAVYPEEQWSDSWWPALLAHFEHGATKEQWLL